MTPSPRKKLIEVALPLEAVNAASAREKSIRHGHPSTLHLWWARRPLAACRAVLFAQMVDDPSSVPEEFPDEAAQDRERRRLFRIVGKLAQWENSNDARVVGDARREIARSVARGLGVPAPQTEAEVDAFLAAEAPPVVDPFCGGGSIPLEAQRLGLRARGSDLNPVAVLITKALVEIPPRFAGLPPVNPEARARVAKGAAWNGKGAQGLAEDVRHYGRWMRDEAHKRIGCLYPKARLADGTETTVIAWLWARTVASPNPAAAGAHVPLASSFVLSSKKGREAVVVPAVENGGWRFAVKTGGVSPDELARARKGTKAARGANFTCLLSGAPIPAAHIKAEGMAGRMGARLMAVVAEGKRKRIYLEPTAEMEETAQRAEPEWRPEQELPDNSRWFSPPDYGMTTYVDLFTPRQLAALATFSNLVSEARERVQADACAAGMNPAAPRLAEDGTGAQAYADAVTTYLGLATDKAADRWSGICGWDSSAQKIRNTFSRQAIAMVWDYAETNPFSGSTSNWMAHVDWVWKAVNSSPSSEAQGLAIVNDAADKIVSAGNAVISTDPPYYDNIGYADLSDFFYVWLRRALADIHPALFRTLLVPKAAELVATPYRFGGSREKARDFFETGLGRAIANMRAAQAPDYPMAMFYAYKQAETKADGDKSGATASTGWETMLLGMVEGGFTITGTWPVRSELANRPVARNANALASSIVLACRPRTDDAPMETRRGFAAALRRELPPAIRRLRAENIAPVDLAQAAIGPGMAVFSRNARVLEANGKPMPVRDALAEINRVLDETLAEAEGDMDAETRFCVAWFEQYGTAERPYGEAEVLCTAKNTSFDSLEKAGVVAGRAGRVRLKRRDELDPDWDPARDRRIVDWECAQHLVRALTAETGGGVAEAARLVDAMGLERAEKARALAYRLYTLSERKGWNGEALACNILATSWPQIRIAAAQRAAGGPPQAEMGV